MCNRKNLQKLEGTHRLDDGIVAMLAFNVNQMEEDREDPRRWKDQSHFLSIRTELHIETYNSV